jgi:hypothetical protein
MELITFASLLSKKLHPDNADLPLKLDDEVKPTLGQRWVSYWISVHRGGDGPV